MDNKLANGYKWSLINVSSKTIAQVAYTAVISRLLNANIFGVIAMATLVINFGNYFAKLGLGPAIIQKNEINNEEKNAAFTSATLLGLFVTVLVFISAPLVGGFFDSLAVVSVIRVLSISFFINGLSTAPISLLSRELCFKKIALIEILAYIIGNIVIGISLAFIGFGEWSLVFATLSQQLIITLLSLSLVKYKFKFTFNKDSYKELYSYGLKSTVNNIADYFIVNTDKIFIGKMDSIFLGQYNRISSIIIIPFEQITISLSRVFFPQISKLQNDKIELKKVYKKYYSLFATILMSLGFGAIASTSNVIRVVLGSQWVGINNIFIVVVLFGVFYYLTHFNAVLCDALGKLKSKLKIQIINLIIILILSLIVFKLGAFAILIIMLISKFINFIVYSTNTKIILGYSSREYLMMHFYIIRSSLIVFLLITCFNYIANIYNIDVFMFLFYQLCLGVIGLAIGVYILPNNGVKCIVIDIMKKLQKHILRKVNKNEE